MRRLLLLAPLLLSACYPSRGECDPVAAEQLAYDGQGTPYFAGQAMMMQSCGNGGFCHSESDIPVGDRFGAPHDLSFDLSLVSTNIEINLDEVERLRRTQARVAGMSGPNLFVIDNGSMPPPDDAYDAYRRAVPADTYQVVTGPRTFADLPDIRSAEGREVVRNWLACGTPVVERTFPRVDRPPQEELAGFTVDACERGCVDPTWPAIYERILHPTCARSRCHAAEENVAGALDLAPPSGAVDADGRIDFDAAAAAVHSRLVGAPSRGDQCDDRAMREGWSVVTAGDADASLLWLKVAGFPDEMVECGSAMPITGNALSEQRLCALQAWIECGACPEADGGACRSCIEGRRAACNVSDDGECIEARECAASFDLPL